MNTNTFKITYASGLESEMITDDATVEAFCNSHFGSTWPVAQENGATVEMAAGVDADRLEAERLEAERLEAERLEAERLEQQKQTL